MMKRFFCVLLSLMLLAAAPLALAEDAAPAEEAAAEEQAPVLLATVNGKEIMSDNLGYVSYMDYYLDQLAQYSVEEGTEEYILYSALFKKAALDYAMQYVFFDEQAEALGIQADPAAREQYEQSVRDYWNSQITAYVDAQGLSEDATEEERSAAAADAAAVFESQYGYTEESFVKENMDEYDYYCLQEPVEAELTKDVTVTEEQLKERFDEMVDEDRKTYEGDVGSYEFYTQYYGQPSYYTPEGYRGVIHILLDVDEELMTAWKNLSAKLEEQTSAANAEPTDTEAPAADAEPTDTEVPAADAEPTDTEAPAADAEPTDTEVPAADAEPTDTEAPAADAEPAEEPVTQEMVDAAKQAILDSVQGKVDEIKAKLDGGASFTDLINEYGTDSGMKDAAKLAQGYMVHKDSILWDPAFRDTAMALEKVGDISEPVVGQYGVHILQYLRDVPEGAVEMTDEIRSDLTSTLLDEAKNDKLTRLVSEWSETTDIQYTAEGQAILDAAAAAEAELTAEQNSSEEAETPAGETPADEAPAAETEEKPAE